MQAYIINLDRSKDRYEFVSQQFDELGITYKRVSAIDKDSQASFDYLQTDCRYWPKLFNAEFACFLSHMKCWEEIAKSDDSYGAVFEDDVILSDALKHFFSTDVIPVRIDILQLETFNLPVKVDKLGAIPFLDRKAVKLITFQPGGAGYVLSKSVARELLDICRNGLNCPVDHFLFDPKFEVVKKFNVRHLIEGLVIQQDRISTSERVFNSEIGLRSSSHLEKLEKIHLPFRRKLKREFMRIFNRFYYKFFTIDLSKIDFK